MKKFSLLYVDPPWEFSNKKTGDNMKSGAKFHYPTMSMKELLRLPVQDICKPDAVLCMWWVASQPVEAIRLVNAWGFQIKTMTGFVWVKESKGSGKLEVSAKGRKLAFGMGFWTRAGSECCLIAVRGKIKRENAGVRSVILAPVENHSKKPDVFRDEIVKLMGDVPRVELFARNESPGWDIWGNEVNSTIKL